jgi:hypothetical protein
MDFYLGTHEPAWLGMTDVPLFVSRIRLARRKTLPRALGPWAMDSGGFSELDKTGEWSITAKEYAAFVRRCRDEIGNLRWAAVMDWMCEPRVRAKTFMPVGVHQARTINSYVELTNLAPDLPWVPVLQGWGIADYWRHVEMYARRGIDLYKLPLVGVGSVCRRQSALNGALIVSTLATKAEGRTVVPSGLKLHGFGFKLTGLEMAGEHLASADSLAWSFDARRLKGPLPGCTHAKCNNCLRYALAWRERVLSGAPALPAAA